MRGPFAVFLMVSVLVLGLAASSAADTVVAKDRATVYLKPGEGSKVVVKLKSGEEMTVVRRDGRWIKVRVRGRTGFIPRTKVTGGDGDEDGEPVQRQTRRRPYVDGRSTDRSLGGDPPDDRRGIDAVDNVDSGDASESEPRELATKPTRKRESAREEEDPIDEATVELDDEPDGRTKTQVRQSREQEEDPDVDKDVDKDVDNDSPDEEEVAPSRPMVRLTKTAQLRAKPGAKSKKIATVEAGQFAMLEERGGWTKIESDEGKQGWVPNTSIIAAAPATRGLRLRAGAARLGFTSIGQGTRSTGGATGIPDNYNLSTSGVSVNLGGMIAYPVRKRFYAGGELLYIGTKALPGINYKNVTTGISLHNIDLRVLGGYDLRNKYGMVAWGRLGYHYDTFSVANVSDLLKNTAKLPSENLSGVTAGLAMTVPHLRGKFGASAGFDAILFSTRTQTKNLEDGASPSTSGLWFVLTGIYKYTARMSIEAGYRLTYLSNSFGAPLATSMRGHTGTQVSRTDVSHGLSVGISQAF
jgi:SH3-like domain-containing protein